MTTTQAIFIEHLTQVLRDIVHNQETGLLTVDHFTESGIEKGQIFFADGDAISARTQREQGEAALFRIGAWKGVYYAFFEGVESPIRNSSSSHDLNQLLMSLVLQPERHTPPLGVPAISKLTTLTPIRTTPLPKLNTAELSYREDISSRGVHAIFRAVPSATSKAVMNKMTRRDRMVFVLLDGRRTVRDIAKLIHRTELDIARTMVHLLQCRFIEYAGS